MALTLDVLILAFLGATIFYAIKLSKSLNEFKAHRNEFNNVITSLLSAIDKAERSINDLKKVSMKEAAELERMIKKSKLMFEDLKIINEAGENMAKRLEKLAEKNREIAQKVNPSASMSDTVMTVRDDDKIHSKVSYSLGEIEEGDQGRVGVGSKKNRVREIKKRIKNDYKSTLKTVEKDDIEDNKFPSFMIRDRDFLDVASLEDHLDASTSNDDNYDMPEELQSKAERELFAALKANEKNNRGR